MALIKCAECGDEISDKAVACPRCGYPLQESQDRVESPAPQQRRARGRSTVETRSIRDAKPTAPLLVERSLLWRGRGIAIMIVGLMVVFYVASLMSGQSGTNSGSTRSAPSQSAPAAQPAAAPKA